MTKRFDYSRLPLMEIAESYRRGESWHSLARRYGCPDQKTLARYVMALAPDLPVRDRMQAQRTRRAREGAGGKTVKVRRAWWQR